MALVLADRVKETTTTVGTGPVTLAGAVSGFQSFAAIGDGNTTYYTIASATDWEVGIGTYTASGTTLSRDTVFASSTGGLVSFTAGSKDVFVTYPAEVAAYISGSVTDNAIARFDGTSGAIQNSAYVTINDAGTLTGNVEATGGGIVYQSNNTVGATTRPQFILRRARGDILTPTKALSGDFLGSLAFQAYSGTGTTYRTSATISVLTTEDGDIGAGATIQFYVGNATLTTQTRVFDMNASYIDTVVVFRPRTNDGAALGDTTRQWSDLFLATGGVINWNNGNATLTHSSGLLASNVNFTVPTEPYGAGWNGSNQVPTKDAVYDKIEAVAASSMTIGLALPVRMGSILL